MITQLIKDRLVRLACKMIGGLYAEDVVNDVLRQCAENSTIPRLIRLVNLRCLTVLKKQQDHERLLRDRGEDDTYVIEDLGLRYDLMQEYEKLPSREQAIVKARYEGYTLDEIALQHGVTKERVRQLLLSIQARFEHLR